MRLLCGGAVAQRRCRIVALLLLRSGAVAQWHDGAIARCRFCEKKRERGVVLSIEMN